MQAIENIRRIQKLATMVSNNCNLITDYYLQNGDLTPPSFSQNVPDEFPTDLAAPISEVLDATIELHDLFLGPARLLQVHGTHNVLVSMHVIASLDVASKLPLNEARRFDELAESCGAIDADLFRRLLRHAIAYRIFEETSPGIVTHSGASKMLRQKSMRDWVLVNCEEMWPAATKTVEAIRKWPRAAQPHLTGFALAESSANGSAGDLSTYSIYSTLRSSPTRAARFASAIGAHNTSMHDALAGLLQPSFFDWEKELTNNYDLPAVTSGLVVDVGGAQGALAKAMVRQYPAVRVVVEDLPTVVTAAKETAGGMGKLESQISFLAHDFFEPQPIHGASAYVLRWILHNWSDSMCVTILRNLIPALQPGARILVNEVCLPSPVQSQDTHSTYYQIPLWRLRQLRQMDISMLELFNAQERDLGGWQALFRKADPRFIFRGLRALDHSEMVLLDFQWSAE